MSALERVEKKTTMERDYFKRQKERKDEDAA